MEPIDVVSVILRGASFIAALQAAGLAWFAASNRHTGAAACTVVSGAMAVSAAVALALVLTQRGVDAGRLAGEWSGILDPHLQRMVWSRRPGLSSLLCAAGLLVVAVSAGRSPRRVGWWGCVGALLVVGSFALTGHTSEAAHAGWLRGLVALHVGIAAYWIGAVAGLYGLARTADPQLLTRAAVHFSASAVWLVPLMLPAGALLVWGLLPDLAALRTPYGGFLLAKVSGFSALIVLAAMNRLRHVPALAAGAPAAIRRAAIRRFKHVLVAEYVLLGSVLAATAAMTSLFSWH